MSNPNRSVLTQLHELLTSSFDLEELRTLCFKLGIDYDGLRGEGKDHKARELIAFMARRQRLPELVELARKDRPTIQWPSAPEDLAQDSISGSQEIDAAPTPASTGPTFNISGGIKGAQVSVGGVQSIDGPIEVDMSETTIIRPEEEVIMGDKIEMSGDFRGAIVNVKSRLDKVTQTIQALPHSDDAHKAELVQLVRELQERLAQVPEERVKDAERVSKRVEALAGEIDSDEPDKEMVEMTGESLKRAAQNLKDVLPTVLTIATQIVAHAMRLAG